VTSNLRPELACNCRSASDSGLSWAGRGRTGKGVLYSCPVARCSVRPAAEQEQMAAFLDDNRPELAGALTGLTEEQARSGLLPS
jgi:hypothetical protein